MDAMRRAMGSELTDDTGLRKSAIPVLKLELKPNGSDQLRSDWQMHLKLNSDQQKQLGLDLGNQNRAILYVKVPIVYPYGGFSMQTVSNQILFAKFDKRSGAVSGPSQIKLRIENSTNSSSYLSIDSMNLKNSQRIGIIYQKSFEVTAQGKVVPYQDQFIKDQNSIGAIADIECEIYNQDP